MSTLETVFVLPVECEGDFHSGYAKQFSKQQEQWYPGEPHSVSNFKVFLCSEGTLTGRIDITDMISKADLEKLEEKYIDHCRRELAEER